MRFSEQELELYVMGELRGDLDAVERFLAEDAAARQFVADQARLELALREAVRQLTFCPACDDVIAAERCETCGAAAEAGGFTIERVLVQNAHGRLYVAHDADGRKVALKELAFVQSPGADGLATFEREAGYLRTLVHPGIPRFVASFEEGTGVHTRFYLAQEFIEGESLDRRLATHWFDEAEVVDLAERVLDILVYLQSRSPLVVHRDIKPANLIRREDGSIALVDFGAAYDQGATLGSTMVGTFGYMPTEQMAGLVDATTDTYALGATLLHLLTRREPWRMLGASVAGVANVSPGLLELLHKMTASRPEDRFPSARAALTSLRALGTRAPVVAPAVVAAAAPVAVKPPGRRRWRRRLSVGGALLAAFIMGAAVNDEQHMEEHHYVLADRSAEGEAARTLDAPLPAGSILDVDHDGADVRTVLRSLADAGEVSLVIPAEVRGTVTVHLVAVPWNAAFESILESHGLGYRYWPDARIVRVARRSQLDVEKLAQRERLERRAQLPATVLGDELPEGEPVDLEIDDAPIADVLRTLADVGGVNIVLPDHVRGTVSVHLRDVPWRAAVESVLASQGLGYRYRSEGNLLRVDRLATLDLEEKRASQDPAAAGCEPGEPGCEP